MKNASGKMIHLFRFTAWTLLLLLLAIGSLNTARASDPDDDFVTISSLIAAGDKLSSDGQADLARAKYMDAYNQLHALQQTNPNWNKAIVTYRLKDLAARLNPPVTLPAAPVAGSKPTAAANAAAPSSANQVKLLSPGSEPRATLRLHPAVGDKQTATITTKTKMDGMIAGKPIPGGGNHIPPVTMTMTMEVKNVAPNGDITFTQTYEDVQIAAEAGIPPELAEVIKASLTNLTGVVGTGRTSAQGINLDLQIKPPANASPQFVQTMNQMKESFQFSKPLPDEPVGPGAKWEYRNKISTQGMTLNQTITSELVSLKDNQIVVNTTLAYAAANQKISNPGMPGVKMELVSVTGSGTGNATHDLSRLLPSASKQDATIEMAMTLTHGQQKQDMSTKVQTSTALESK